VKLIVGLGNPGKGYESTRHNAGYEVIDALVRESGAPGWSARCESRVAEVALAGEQVILAKPLTYMNRSGSAIRRLLEENRLDPGQLVVIYDDLDLPLGRIRIRERGSAGGHRGMESIIGMIGSGEFIRVRLGIGEENMPEDKAGFVLAAVPPGAESVWDEMIARAARAVACILADGAPRAMSLFNFEAGKGENL
jgi:PTH1 family peptidyl-tRNA hydrolase